MTLGKTRLEASRASNPLASKSNATKTNSEICSLDPPKGGENDGSIGDTLITTENAQRTTRSDQRTNLDMDYQTCNSIEMKNLDLTNKKSGSGGKNRDHGPIGYKKK